ncbi:MAG: hypothetical protein HN353_13360 [Bdellovibrionales bacterium]|jgi:hypothetical protein|nr:hypothetical protein [Bdellovibrionales bacterium]MBT3524920.1 hypothetical protein [Bdellovibrionales bacterium]MBT7670280.1 hypothetical protein [Bdellovibrionales bacterium]MBT7767455.1 hypothetical protein [Bdellovibrionales bacterium]
MKQATYIWAILILLTTTSFLLAKLPSLNNLSPNLTITFALTSGMIKFSLIFLYFMEMKKTHFAWRYLMGALLLTFIISIYWTL